MEPAAIPLSAEELNGLRQKNLGRLLIRAFDTFEADVLETFEHHGIDQLRKTYLPVLRNLDLQGNRITELADRAGLSKQTVGPLVHELADLGIVRIEPDPTDGRAKIVQWTNEGLQGLSVGLEALQEVTEKYARVLGEDRMEHLRSTLLLLLDAFERPG